MILSIILYLQKKNLLVENGFRYCSAVTEIPGLGQSVVGTRKKHCVGGCYNVKARAIHVAKAYTKTAVW